MACLEDSAPLLDSKLKCLCSVPGERVCSCPSVSRRDEHIPSKGWPFPWRCFARLKILSLYFSTASRSLFCLLTLVPHCFSLSQIYKRTWHPDPNKMVILRRSPAIFSVSSFLNKVSFLASIPCLSDSLSCCAVSRASLDSVTHGL